MSDELGHYCGVFGIFGHAEASRIAYLGLYALQHRGQESAGIASVDGGTLFVEKGMGHVADVFDEARLDNLPGDSAIGHVRYSTTGHSVFGNAQPIRAASRRGEVAIGHNGNLVNAGALRAKLEQRGSVFTSTNDTEVILHLLARSAYEAVEDGFADALGRTVGAFSIVALTSEEFVAARDPFGFRPLSIGVLDGAVVVASETTAFDLIGARPLRDLAPGEIVAIKADAATDAEVEAAIQAGPGRSAGAFRSVTPWPERPRRQCIFEHVYFARPDSVLYGASVHEARKSMGRLLATVRPVDADVVVPIPDGGTYAAQGYAEASGIPFEQALIRNHYVGRTFIEPRQSIRHFGVKIKLNPVRRLIEGQRVVLVDDSIVRGTTSGKIVEMLRTAGASEVHFRVSSPPYVSPCYYGIDTPHREDLVAANHSVEEIGRQIGADTLAYLTLDRLRAAVPAGECDYCVACFTGEYPTPLGGDLDRQLELFEPAGHGPAVTRE